MEKAQKSAFRTFLVGVDSNDSKNNKKLNSVSSLLRRSRDNSSTMKFLNHINLSVIGSQLNLPTPFGLRKMTYLDYTASGRALTFVEDYLRDSVLPFYANTHSSSSATAHMTSLYRSEARQIIKDAVHGTDDDVVFFVGNGATGAIDLFIRLLGLQQAKQKSSQSSLYTCSFPGCKRAAFTSLKSLKLHQRTHTDGDFMSGTTKLNNVDACFTNEDDQIETCPIVSDTPSVVIFVGPYAHHSNLLPWRESTADVVIEIRESQSGGVDMNHLEEELKNYQDVPCKIGTFSAASNITGTITNVDEISALLHQYNALCAFDYATAAPHLKIDMNPPHSTKNLVAKDAVFISTHKFVGGPSCPGVLVVKKKVISNVVPSIAGGGTVFFVTKDGQTYLENLEEREEGGTPDIIGSIRAGIVFHLKESIGQEVIHYRESTILNKVWNKWSKCDEIVLLGKNPAIAPRLSIVSFLIKPKNSERYLHYNFVSTLLNDLFGIQVRGGCVCAGPYAIRLLGIQDYVKEFELALLEKDEIFRPGFTRLNLPFFMSDAEVEFVILAVEWIAEHGHKLLPQYIFYDESGEFKHRSLGIKTPHRMWLQAINYDEGGEKSSTTTRKLQYVPKTTDDGAMMALFNSYIAQAHRAASDAIDVSPRLGVDGVVGSKSLKRNLAHLRWFLLADDAMKLMLDISSKEAPTTHPLRPTRAARESNSIGNNSSIIDVSSVTGSDTDSPTPDTHQQSPISSSGASPVETSQNTLSSTSVTTTTIMSTSTSTSMSMSTPSKDTSNKFHIDISKATNQEPSDTSCVISSALSRTVEVGSDACEGVIEYEYNTCPSTGNLEYTAFVHRHQSIPGNQKRFTMKGKKKGLFPKLKRKIISNVGSAIRDFNMIHDGDRLLLGLSGGKDSLTMLHVLLHFQRVAPIKFEIGCITIDPQASGFDPSPLRGYLKELGIPYFYESSAIVPRALVHMTGPKQSICSWCSRMKRGVLYSRARKEKYNVLVLAQHLDDLCESFIMSSFYNGMLRTMKANYTCAAGDIRVIRPFVYLRERAAREFAHSAKLPIIIENCPACFEGPKERYRIKTLLAAQEQLFPNLYQTLLTSMMPLIAIDKTTASSSIAGEIDNDDHDPLIPQNNKNYNSNNNNNDNKINENNNKINNKNHPDYIPPSKKKSKRMLRVMQQVAESTTAVELELGSREKNELDSVLIDQDESRNQNDISDNNNNTNKYFNWSAFSKYMKQLALSESFVFGVGAGISFAIVSKVLRRNQ